MPISEAQWRERTAPLRCPNCGEYPRAVNWSTECATGSDYAAAFPCGDHSAAFQVQVVCVEELARRISEPLRVRYASPATPEWNDGENDWCDAYSGAGEELRALDEMIEEQRQRIIAVT